jgi:cytochrome c oxidase assembly protein subunit 19
MYKGSPAQQLTPPDKGSFPLDHDGACRESSKEFLRCLKEQGAESIKCRHLTKDFLRCRMQHGLMAKEDLDNLGFEESAMQETARIREEKARVAMEKQEVGFVGGMTTVQAREEKKR